MRTITGWMLTATGALAACGSGHGGEDHDQGPTTTVTIRTGANHIDLLTFRDDADATWHAGTQVGPGEYTIAVTGPYWISLVCHSEYFSGTNLATNNFSTLKLGRTLDDAHVVDQPLCPANATAPRFLIRGDLGLGLGATSGGKISLGDGTIEAGDTGAFQARAEAGTYDLYAAAAGRLLITRDLEISADVDLDLDVPGLGAQLVAAPFTVANAASGSNVQLSGSVQIERGHRTLAEAFQFSKGDPASLLAAPPGLALASDEFQTAAVTETTSTSDNFRVETRSYRQPYQPGDSTVLTLPAPLPHTNWEIQDGPPSASWFELPEEMTLRFVMVGYGNDHTFEDHLHVLQLSSAFRKATGATRVEAETDMPGYQPAWAPDPAAIYRLNTYSETDGDPATTPVSAVSDEWQLGIID